MLADTILLCLFVSDVGSTVNQTFEMYMLGFSLATESRGSQHYCVLSLHGQRALVQLTAARQSVLLLADTDQTQRFVSPTSMLLLFSIIFFAFYGYASIDSAFWSKANAAGPFLPACS